MIASRPLAALLVFLLLLLLPGKSRAASGGDDILVAGTTSYDSQSRDWAYLCWITSDPATLRARVFAVYAKPGDANSTANYERQAILRVQTDPTVIQPLLQRSVHLGQDLNYLEETINSLFEKLILDAKLPLAQKLSAVIRGSLDNPDQFKNLVLMARTHPGVALCLGWAHAALIPGPVGTRTTFEVRVFDVTNDRDLGVVGRSTVRARQPVVLPAPGRPIEVPDVTPKGDLNAKMRWSTPDALRRHSVLQHGFNVYRVPAVLAQQNNWHLAPPSTGALLAAVQSNPLVHRLNHVPVLQPRDYTEAEALNLAADATTFFYSDWNDRFNPNTQQPQNDFINGAQFYYFLTARDLLGRDGLVSRGTLMTICDRMPPQAPSRVRVSNHYVYNGVPQQHLQVVWNQNANTNDITTAYYIYRWTSLPEMHAHAGDPGFNLVAGPILHLAGSPTNSYLDNGPGSPLASTQSGVTFWYTVIALDHGACAPGGNRSPHSAPAFGVLRDRVGPAGGDGELEITCTEPTARFVRDSAPVPTPGLATNALHFRLTTERLRPAIEWTEFYYDLSGLNTQRVHIARQFFVPGLNTATVDFALPKNPQFPALAPRFYCRIGAANGKVSEFAVSSTIIPAPDGSIRPVFFSGTIESRRVRPGGDCTVHDPHGDGDGDGTIDEICVTANLSPGTKEVKFYRRVENGPLTLVCQREADATGAATATCCDGSMPAQPSDICYFIQQFDEHGNASSMVRIGCVKTGPNAPLPTPILSPLTAIGTSTNARMRLQWFCPPYGVERFEVWVAGAPLPPGKSLSPDLTLTNTIELGLPLPGVPMAQPKLLTFLSRRIGPSFGNGSVFTTEADITVGNHYAVFVRAVGKDGSIGPKSNTEQFTWHVSPNGPVTNVPWPARSLPAVTSTNFPRVHARMFNHADPAFLPFPQQRFEGVGIRVGAVTMPLFPPNMTNAIAGAADPLDHVYRSARDQGRLFPLVVYRAQIPNAAFPDVSQDVVQVTPLMEEIAFDRGLTPNGANAVFVHDPFIRLIPTTATPSAPDWELYLLDTQPVVDDATYQYFLVRLNPDTREIAEVMPTNPVQTQ